MELMRQWPELAWEEWADDGEYAAYVDADRGEDAAGADSAAEPLVECAAVCDGAGAGDVGDGYAATMCWILSSILWRMCCICGWGRVRSQAMQLKARTVADFYKEYLECLAALGVSVKINPMPVEVANPIRFDLDTEHKSYDPEYAQRFWQVLVQAEKVFRALGDGVSGEGEPGAFFLGEL